MRECVNFCNIGMLDFFFRLLSAGEQSIAGKLFVDEGATLIMLAEEGVIVPVGFDVDIRRLELV